VALSRSVLSRLTVTIDARALGATPGGTQLYTLELALALARTGDVAVRMVVADADVTDATRAVLEGTDQVEVITYDQAVAGVALSEIVHRPQQVFSVHDLNLLRLLGRRIVVTHQDLIAYHNPTYHPSLDTWEQYRRVTRIALAAADRVVFFSAHSLRDATAEDLVAADRCDVIGAAIRAAPVSETSSCAWGRITATRTGDSRSSWRQRSAPSTAGPAVSSWRDPMSTRDPRRPRSGRYSTRTTGCARPWWTSAA
jgi:hypothetical protein